MSSIIAYSQIVQAVISKEAWDETFFSLMSLKAHIQSLPGWQRFDLWANYTAEGDVNMVAVTNWEYPEQLELWLKQGVTVDAILRAMQPPPADITVQVYEEIA